MGRLTLKLALAALACLLLAGCSLKTPVPVGQLRIAPGEVPGLLAADELEASDTLAVEIRAKFQRLQRIRRNHKAQALVLTLPEHITWALGGLITPEIIPGARYAVLIGSRKERLIAPSTLSGQLQDRLQRLGVQVETYDWRDAPDQGAILQSAEKFYKGRLLCDDPRLGLESIESELQEAKLPLTPQEADKYRWLGQAANWVISRTASNAERGETEAALAANLYAGCVEVGLKPIEIWAAVDDRAYTAVGALPSTQPLGKLAVLSLRAERWGLKVKLARTFSLGKAPGELVGDFESCTTVLESLVAAAKPSAPLSDCYKAAQAAARTVGLQERFQFLLLGGVTGACAGPYYRLIKPDQALLLLPPSPLAVGFSSGAVQLAETVLVTGAGPEVVTLKGGYWPRRLPEEGLGSLSLAEILEIPLHP